MSRLHWNAHHVKKALLNAREKNFPTVVKFVMHAKLYSGTEEWQCITLLKQVTRDNAHTF